MRIFRNWASWRRLRYVLVTIAAVSPIWFLALSYIMFTPPSYEASMTLILPGEGPTASLTLNDVGQASTHSASPWSSSRLSPVESYRKLMMTDAVRRRAAETRGLAKDEFPEPKIKLVDQTNLMMISMRGKSRQGAEENAMAFLASFNAELSKLRADFTATRETANRAAIEEYKEAVVQAQRKILTFKQSSGLNSADDYDEVLSDTRKLELRQQDIDTVAERVSGEINAFERSLGTSVEQAALALKLRSDLLFQAMLQEGAQLKIDFEKARRRYGPKHPEFTGIATRYRATMDALERRGQILTGLEPARFRAVADLASDGARESMLSALVEAGARRSGLIAEREQVALHLASARASIMTLAGPAAELDRLARDHQVAEAVFASALARADTTKTDLFAAYPLAQIVEVPLASEKPVSPSKKIGIIAAVAGTFFVAFGLALMWLRRTILRWIGRLFLHPGSEIETAAADKPTETQSPPIQDPEFSYLSRKEPTAPSIKSLDDEPLIEIPHQTPRSTEGDRLAAEIRKDADAS